jgi:3-methyladenine DNA glycosylase AlkD
VTLAERSNVARAREILQQLNRLGDRSRLAGMARYGIATAKAVGVSVPELRAIAKRIGTDHELAIALWASEIHEAPLLAGMIDDPERVTEAQMDAWVYDLDSWDVCDQVCGNLFDRTPYAVRKAVEWSGREDEFVKRAGFVLMAVGRGPPPRPGR